MKNSLLLLFCFFISVSVVAETVYKKTNPDGSITFTDTPSTDSEEIKVRKPTTYKPLNLPAPRLPTKKLSPSFDYTVTINNPSADAVITDNIDVVVSVSVEPALKTGYGHQIVYQMGGNSKKSQALTATFKNVSRGSHNLSVSIIDRTGEIVSRVASTSFHMKRFFKKPAKPKAKKKAP